MLIKTTAWFPSSWTSANALSPRAALLVPILLQLHLKDRRLTTRCALRQVQHKSGHRTTLSSKPPHLRLRRPSQTLQNIRRLPVHPPLPRHRAPTLPPSPPPPPLLPTLPPSHASTKFIFLVFRLVSIKYPFNISALNKSDTKSLIHSRINSSLLPHSGLERRGRGGRVQEKRGKNYTSNIKIKHSTKLNSFIYILNQSNI